MSPKSKVQSPKLGARNKRLASSIQHPASGIPTHAPRATRHAQRFNAPTLQRSHAFTLVEILVALGIFSIVLAAIYSTWSSILRASKVGQDAAAAVQRARMTARTLEEALGSAQGFAANQPYYAFVVQNGSEASLSFVTRLAKSFPRSGKFGDLDVRRVTFSLENSADGGKVLVLRQNPLLMDVDEDEKNHPIVLAKHAKSLNTEYWDQRQQEWADDWEKLGTNILPVMVRVSLQLADNSHSSMVREQITRIVSLPATTVQPTWQSSPAPGPPGGGLPPPPGGGGSALK